MHGVGLFVSPYVGHRTTREFTHRLFSGRGRPNVVVLERRLGSAFLASLATHLGLVVIAVLALRSAAAPPRGSPTAENGHVPLFWLTEPGPGGGGGGGGNRRVEPPRRAELPGRDALTVRVTEPSAVDPSMEARREPEPIPRLTIPVAAAALGTETFPGAVGAPPSPTESQGSGDGGGAGTGTGTGDGPGRGPGLGDGVLGGTGGDFYRPGSDISMPIEIRKGAPRYTAEAIRAHAQGAITVECVVQTTGVCTRIRVTRSLNPAFGLDQEAIKAVEQWRFRPGMRRGEPVPVLVTMEIAFVLR
jgi:TonB family protein